MRSIALFLLLGLAMSVTHKAQGDQRGIAQTLVMDVG